MDRAGLHGIQVLVVDDDLDLCELLEAVLTTAGAAVSIAMCGTDALRRFEVTPPDVVLLDVMMPGMDGLTVCTEMMRIAEVPIILLTVLNGDDETVSGLSAGAIDYVTKPFSVKVLLARVSAAVRRGSLPPPPTVPAYDDGYLHVGAAQREVSVDGEQIELTQIEYRLLSCLLANPGGIVSLEEILGQVWGLEYADSPNYVHVYISRLRGKLDPPSGEHAYLDNVRGTGYRFVPR